MSKHGMRGHPPKVVVTTDQGKGNVVGMKERGAEEVMTPEVDPDMKDTMDPRCMCLGRFTIPQDGMRHRLDDVISFMKDVVVTRAELQFTPQGNLFMYTGISEKHFDRLTEGQMIPNYVVAKRVDGVLVVTKMEASRIKKATHVPPNIRG